MDDIYESLYLQDIVPSWNRSKPNFMAFLKLILTPLLSELQTLLQLQEQFSIDNATGKNLDIIGMLVGASRTLPVTIQGYSSQLEDEDYRLVIRAQIARNHWDGTIQGLMNVADELFPSFGIQIQDISQSAGSDRATGKYSIKAKAQDITDIQEQMLKLGLLLPRPAGVEGTVTIKDADDLHVDVTVQSGLFETGRDTLPEVE